MAPCNVLFDIANAPYQEHILDWPEEFYRDSWSSTHMEATPVEATTTDPRLAPIVADDLSSEIVNVSVQEVEFKQSTIPNWQLITSRTPGSYAASELQWLTGKHTQ